MSIDNSYIPSNVSGAGASGVRTETASMETLKTAFAEAMRLSLSGGSSSDSTLLEATDTAAQRRAELNGSQKTEDRSQEHAQTERQELNRSETRQVEMEGEYDDGLQRRDEMRNDFTRKTERTEALAATEGMRDVIPISEGRVDASLPISAISMTSANPFSLASTASTPNAEAPTVGTLPGSFLVAGASSLFAGPVETGAAPNISMPATSTPTLPGNVANISTNLQATASVLTIFSASGRIGEKNEADDEKTSEKKKEKKTVSLFGRTVFGAFPETNRKSATVETTEQRKPESFSVREWNGEDFADEETKDEPPEKAVPVFPEKTTSTGTCDVSSNSDLPESNGEERVDQIRFIQRVAAACQSAAQQQGNLRIKLNLDQFGSLTIRSSSRGGRLAVRLEASTEAAAHLLREHLDELKHVLAEQNVDLDRLDVVLSATTDRGSL